RELRQLVPADVLVLRRVVAENVLVSLAIAKLLYRPVWKHPALALVLPPSAGARPQLLRPQDERPLQLREAAPQNQPPAPGDGHPPQPAKHEQRVRFTTAGRTTVQHLVLAGHEELLLPWRCDQRPLANPYPRYPRRRCHRCRRHPQAGPP